MKTTNFRTWSYLLKRLSTYYKHANLFQNLKIKYRLCIRNIFVWPVQKPTFAPRKGLTCLRQVIKREVRCKSGAIPVAVKPPRRPREQLQNISATVCQKLMGRPFRRWLSQKTCPFQDQPFTLSGEKQEMYRLHRPLHFYPIFRKQSPKTF